MEIFKIAKNNKEHQVVHANRIIISGVECFIFKDAWGYNISHVATGMAMSINLFDKRKAIAEVKKNMKQYPDWHSKGIETLKKYGFDYPLNN